MPRRADCTRLRGGAGGRRGRVVAHWPRGAGAGLQVNVTGVGFAWLQKVRLAFSVLGKSENRVRGVNIKCRGTLRCEKVKVRGGRHPED